MRARDREDGLGVRKLARARVVLFVACGSGSSTVRGADRRRLPSTRRRPWYRDAKLRAADFPNINEMTGSMTTSSATSAHLAQALAVSHSATAGAIRSHRPPTGAAGGDGEARAGLQARRRNDWEFFSLDVSASGTRILSRGGARC